MMKFSKKLLSLLLCAVMVLGSVAIGGGEFAEVLDAFSVKASAAKITDYKFGDIIEFGSYPQGKITDSNIITALNSTGGNWISYNYYSGNGEYGSMVPGNWMRYKDVEYESVKYRGVIFDSYRPFATNLSCLAENSNQDEHGYHTDEVYWFKYEPIKWKVLDAANGLVMSEIILDTQAFSNIELVKNEYHYNDKNELANDWDTSSLREWLISSFSDSAFSNLEKSKIDGNVTILSIQQVTNTSYGFSNKLTNTGNFLSPVTHPGFYDPDSSRCAKYSDYAACQGVGVIDGYATWATCSKSMYYTNPWSESSIHNIGTDGRTGIVPASDAELGIRPVLKINPECDISGLDETNTKVFTIGRDNNHFIHSDGKDKKGNVLCSPQEADNYRFGFYGINYYSDGFTKSGEEKLYSFTTESEEANIKERLNSEWKGSCYGTAATIGLAFFDSLPVVNSKASYYDMPLPNKDSDFMNEINYYQLSQHIDAYSKYEKSFYKSTIFQRFDAYNDFSTISDFFTELFNILDSEGLAQLSFGYCIGNETHGHSIVATGYLKHNDGSYTVNLYDENGATSINMDVSKNKDTFSFTDGNDNLINNNTYRYLSLYNYKDYIRVEQPTNLLNAKSSTQNKYYITVTDGSDFEISDTSGKTLYCKDGIYSGTMDVLDISSDINGESVEYKFTVNGEPDISFSSDETNNEFTISNNSSYSHIEAAGADEISVNLNENVIIEGDNSSFSICTNCDWSDNLYMIAGSTGSKCSLSYETDSINISNKNGNTNASIINSDGSETEILSDEESCIIGKNGAQSADVLKCSISSTNNIADKQTVTLSLEASFGIAGYYWGTNSDYTKNTFYSVAGGLKAAAVTKSISTKGTYYLTVKDVTGSVSQTVSITYCKLDFSFPIIGKPNAVVLMPKGTTFDLPDFKEDGYWYIECWQQTDISREYDSGDPYTVTKDVLFFGSCWYGYDDTMFAIVYEENIDGYYGKPFPMGQYIGKPLTVQGMLDLDDVCVFTGWNTKPDGSGVDYMPGDTYSGNIYNEEEQNYYLTLYAQWAPAGNDAEDNADAVIRVAASRAIDYRTQVTILASASGISEGYHLEMTVNGQTFKGDRNQVKSSTLDLRSDINYTVKVVKDSNGEEQTELTKQGGTIYCNAGFFKKLIAFFKGLFNLLPKVEVKP